MFGNPLKLVALLRPGMSVVEATALLARGRVALDSPPRDPISYSIFHQRGELTRISFYRAFPATIRVAGVSIGMSEDDVRSIIPDLEAVYGLPFYLDKPKHWATLAREKCELFLNFEDGKVGCIELSFIGSRDEKLSHRLKAEESSRREESRTRARLLTDPESILTAWVENAPVGSQDRMSRYAAWLRSGDPERWHDAADHWNWDYGVEPLRWIVAQPDCDLATALVIFYDGEPLDQPADGDEGRLVAKIRSRWPKFSSHDIGYEPPAYVTRLSSDKHLDLIPLSMRSPIVGRSLAAREYFDGTPIEIGFD